MNNTFIISISVLCFLQMCFLFPFVKNMIPEKNNKSLIFKMICSTCFLSTGIISCVYFGTGTYSSLIVAGLCLSWLGDLFLQIRGSKIYFLVGGIFFLLTHVLYICAFYSQFKPRLSSTKTIVIFDALLCIAVITCFELINKKKHISLKKFHAPVLIYACMLTTMLSEAFFLSRQFFIEGNISSGVLILIGAVLFFISDFTLAYSILDESKKINITYKFASSFSYFCAQTLLAISIIFI